MKPLRLITAYLALLALISSCSSIVYVENCEHLQGNLYKCEAR